MKARLPKGMGSMGNIQQLAQQAKKMQEKMEQATNELLVKEYEATAGGNAVSVVVTGNMEIKSINIEKEVVDPDDVEMLSDLITAAVNEALRKASQDKEDTIASISGSMGMPGMF